MKKQLQNLERRLKHSQVTCDTATLDAYDVLKLTWPSSDKERGQQHVHSGERAFTSLWAGKPPPPP